MARPRTQFDLELIERLCAKMATYDDLAHASGCSTRSIIRAYQTRPAFQEAVDRGWATARQSLRQKQLEIALSGNAAMLIWLGKQYLGQKDKQEIGNKTEANITLQRAMEELRGIPRGQLLEAHALLSAGVG